MIEAVVFDLDGTLVQTERLKAASYARAVVELRPDEVRETDVTEAFKDVVGLSRSEVAQALMERFELEDAARSRMEEFGVSKPWQAFVQVRLRYYHDMLDDQETLRQHRWPYAIELLHRARDTRCKTALATMSHCEQARRVLETLGLDSQFDFIATRDDVEHGKPSPEIYLLVSKELAVPPKRCLVIEDSPAGVEAAHNAGMEIVAVGTPFTRRRLHEHALLSPGRIADDPADLPDIVGVVLRETR